MIAQRTLPPSMFRRGTISQRALAAACEEARKRGFEYVHKSRIPSRFGITDCAWRSANGDWLLLRGRVLTLTRRA